MRIGVIGAGWLGGTVGEVLARAGHQVLFSSRHPERHRALVGRLGDGAAAGTVRDAAEHGEAVLFAVPYRMLAPLAEELSGALAGKVAIDACNPNTGYGDPADLLREGEEKGVAVASAERLAEMRYVRAFSSVDAAEIEASAAGRRRAPLAVPLASDDGMAAAMVEGLIRDAGCVPINVGGLAAARGFQRGGPAFRLHVGEAEMQKALGL